jgi:predicted transposase/invertase (TIGR01784 family)
MLIKICKYFPFWIMHFDHLRPNTGMKSLFSRFRSEKALKRRVLEYLSRGKPLSILDDIVFKAMLGSNSEDSNAALRSLLSACTHRTVRAVQVLNNDLVPAHFDAKTARLDVHVTFNDGETADLEMQAGKSVDDLKKRAEFYTSMLMASQNTKGKTYREIKRVYQIFFLNCVLYPQSNKLPRRYFYQEEEEHDRLSEVTEIIFYELPKLEARLNDYLTNGAGTDNLSEDEKWCMYMRYRHEQRAEALIEELCQKEEGIMRAEQAVTRISRDYIRYAKKMAEIKNDMDQAERLLYAREEGEEKGRAEGRQEGRAEGRQEGRAEGIAQVAQKMKALGFSDEQIQSVTTIDR